MEATSRKSVAIIILIGIVLIGVAMLLRFQVQREEPPPPGYYEGPMLPKSQRMGPPGGGGATNGGQTAR